MLVVTLLTTVLFQLVTGIFHFIKSLKMCPQYVQNLNGSSVFIKVNHGADGLWEKDHVLYFQMQSPTGVKLV